MLQLKITNAPATVAKEFELFRPDIFPDDVFVTGNPPLQLPKIGDYLQCYSMGKGLPGRGALPASLPTASAI
jgi:hypothetical protein